MTLKTEPMLTVKIFKDRFLFGIPLVDEDGNKMSDETLSDMLNSAVAEIEDELDLTISPQIFSSTNGTQEKRDYRATDFFNWSFIKLNHHPVLSVEDISMMFPSNYKIISYPKEWFKLNPDSGVFQMLPSASNIPVFYTQSGLFLPEIILAKMMVPQMLEISYTAGFKQDAVPCNINKAVGMRCAIDVLTMVQSIILGAGIDSQSSGLDGMSQSTSTSGYQKAIDRMEARYEKLMNTLRYHYKGIVFTNT